MKLKYNLETKTIFWKKKHNGHEEPTHFFEWSKANIDRKSTHPIFHTPFVLFIVVSPSESAM